MRIFLAAKPTNAPRLPQAPPVASAVPADGTPGHPEPHLVQRPSIRAAARTGLANDRPPLHARDINTPKKPIQAIARDLGFDDCRFALATEAAHAHLLDQWLAEGRHGAMDWMAKNPHRRRDPRALVPEARSVIVLALNYHQPDPPEPADGAARGRIARYAWGDDYHDLIEKKLKAFCERLAALGGIQRRYVDYGPVLERDFATASGLGWNGKSTVQIHRRLGAYFFLAEIITTLEIEPDAPAHDHCGKCTACLDACPTHAITAPRRLDARKCLSYLTIEHPGPIPEEFREALGDRIFGCDDCLDACPWNRFARAAAETRLAARAFVRGTPLREFLALSDPQFRALFARSPIKRIKRPRFLRNVCLALGNTGTSDDLPALGNAARDPDPLISEAARWALARIEARVPARGRPPAG